MQTQINPFQTHHLSACVQLFCAVFNQPPWNEEWDQAEASLRLQEIVGTPGFFGIVAASKTEEANLLGFALGYTEQWNRQKHYYLKEMCVHPDVQHQGVGSAIMQVLEEAVAAQQVSKIYLLTARASSAEAFYQKCGFYVSTKMIMMGKYLT